MTITVVLIALNVISFFLLEFIGQTEDVLFMMEYGAMFPFFISEKGEYWRFLTATFMHFGFQHLLNNMVMLGAAGSILERALGKIKYLILYLVAGIGGCILSYFQMTNSGDYAVSAGASGAVFGIVGALAWILILHKGRYETLTGRGMIGMILLTAIYGVSEGNIDNWGHIGGMLAGFLLCMIFYRRNVKKIDFDEQNLYT